MTALYLLVDAVLVGTLGVWMAVAVADNWRHPKLNLEAVAMVVRFDLMARDYPDDFALLAHRRIDDDALIARLFHMIRAAETLAAIVLFLSAGLLLGAALGAVAAPVATGAAVLSTALFATIWAGFVIGGNYFAYWYCHQWAQSNHFMLLYWGLFVLLVLLL